METQLVYAAGKILFQQPNFNVFMDTGMDKLLILCFFIGF
jgi:hypothetical protein